MIVEKKDRFEIWGGRKEEDAELMRTIDRNCKHCGEYIDKLLIEDYFVGGDPTPRGKCLVCPHCWGIL